MQLIRSFDFEGECLKVYGTNEKPMFKAIEIGELLGLTNIRMLLQDIDDDLKAAVRIPYGRSGHKLTTFIEEPALYDIATRSKKPFFE